ncbi:MAG: hypothetical protein IJH91_08380 [Mogibacterium sp.]|nr:hypothetical protein [Mogibacterium sp.]
MKAFLKALPVSIIVLVILIAIIILYGIAGLPTWPFILLLVVSSECYALKTDGFWIRAVGGLIAILLGFIQVLLPSSLGSGVILAIFLVLVIVLVNLDVMKNKFIANAVTMVIFNIIVQVPGVMTKENVVPVTIAYVVGVAIMAAIIYGLDALAKKGQKKAEAETKAE